MTERDNWADKYDNSGNALVPAMPSPQGLSPPSKEGSGHHREVQRAFAEHDGRAIEKPAQHVLAKRGVNGIMRQDWDKSRDKKLKLRHCIGSDVFFHHSNVAPGHKP
jgi:hypothetical protein